MTILEPAGRNVANGIAGSDWDFPDVDTGYLTHSVHRYSGKFIPQIAAGAIGLLTAPGDLVADPYCGSGTTLLEAALSGRRAIGIDLNPLAVLIASVKTTPVARGKLADLMAAMDEAVGRLAAAAPDRRLPLDRDRDDGRLSDPWYVKWFQPDVLSDLVVLHNAISDMGDPALRNIALVAFSEILRRSSNAHQGYPNVMFDKAGGKRPRPGPRFLKALRQVAAAVASLPGERGWHAVRALQADARHLPIASATVDAVISHPPYIGSIPYAEYGALSLKWLGHDPKAVDRGLTGGQRQSRTILERFTADYRQMLGEAFRITRAGGHLFLLVGNPTVRGIVIDLAGLTDTLAQPLGFRPVATATRSAENRRANRMGGETLLTFVKR